MKWPPETHWLHSLKLHWSIVHVLSVSNNLNLNTLSSYPAFMNIYSRSGLYTGSPAPSYGVLSQIKNIAHMNFHIAMVTNRGVGLGVRWMGSFCCLSRAEIMRFCPEIATDKVLSFSAVAQVKKQLTRNVHANVKSPEQFFCLPIRLLVVWHFDKDFVFDCRFLYFRGMF